MIRTALIAAATVAAIATAATSAQAGYYGHGVYNGHGKSFNQGFSYKPRFFYKRKCHKVKVGHRKVWDSYTYSYHFIPVFKTRCKRIKVWR